MAERIKERRDRRYRVTSSGAKISAVRPPERGATKDRLRKISSRVATTKRYDAAKVVGRH